MPKLRITSIIVPSGTPCPPGFKEGATTRTGTRCIKSEPIAAPVISMNDLESMFGNMGVKAEPEGTLEIEDTQEAELMKMMGVMGIGGRRRTKKAGRRHHKKTIKAGRRHKKSRK